jgi:hypothetical protein
MNRLQFDLGGLGQGRARDQAGAIAERMQAQQLMGATISDFDQTP